MISSHCLLCSFAYGSKIMTIEIKPKNESGSCFKTWNAFDLLLSILNQILIIFIDIYILVLALTYHKFGLFEIHVVLGTLGYQFFMAESILTLSKVNLLARFFSRDCKRVIHLILGVTSTILSVVATVVIVLDRKRHFYSMHGLFGLAAIVFLIPTMINGPITYLSQLLKPKVKPIYMKIYHTTTSSLAFICGVACLCTGYQKNWFKNQVSEEMIVCFIVFSALTIVLTLKEPIINAVQTLRGYFRK